MMAYWSLEELAAKLELLEAAAAHRPGDRSIRTELIAARQAYADAVSRRAAALAELAALDGETL